MLTIACLPLDALLEMLMVMLALHLYLQRAPMKVTDSWPHMWHNQLHWRRCALVVHLVLHLIIVTQPFASFSCAA
jgi:hypothetical protein